MHTRPPLVSLSLIIAQATLYKHLLGDPSVELQFSWQGYPMPASTIEKISFMRLLGPVLIPMMFAFCFISFAFALVSEKAQRMRTVGEMAGLTAGPYWCKPQLT